MKQSFPSKELLAKEKETYEKLDRMLAIAKDIHLIYQKAIKEDKKWLKKNGIT